jgi:hypothetical protein
MNEEFIPIFPPHYKVDAVIMDAEKYEAMKAEIERLRAEVESLLALNQENVEIGLRYKTAFDKMSAISTPLIVNLSDQLADTRARNTELEQQLEQAHSVYREVMAAVRTEKRYVPVEDGYFQSSITTGLYAISINNETVKLHTMRMGDWHDIGIVVLPDNIRLCYLVDVQGSDTQGESQQGDNDNDHA